MKSWNAIRFFVRFLVIGYEIEGRVMSEKWGLFHWYLVCSLLYPFASTFIFYLVWVMGIG